MSVQYAYVCPCFSASLCLCVCVYRYVCICLARAHTFEWSLRLKLYTYNDAYLHTRGSQTVHAVCTNDKMVVNIFPYGYTVSAFQNIAPPETTQNACPVSNMGSSYT